MSLTPTIVPIILSGGSGTRLWPLSTPDNPKQFHALMGGKTLIQDTALRLSGPQFTAPIIIGNARHAELTARQLSDIGIAPACLVLEPQGRNTALAAAVAALMAQRLFPGAQVFLAPADHVVLNPDAFRAAIMRASAVGRDHIVTLGMAPDRATSAYGYIRQGVTLSDGVFKADAFIEKPAEERARALLKQGGYAWNAGVFLFAPDVLLTEMAAHAPDVLKAAQEAVKADIVDGQLHLQAAAVCACPDISIDYAVMEKTKIAAVAPCDAGWADVGSFDEIWRLSAKDANGVATVGPVTFENCRNCLLIASGAPLAVCGLDNQIVISGANGTLALPLGQSQSVKTLVERLKRAD